MEGNVMVLPFVVAGFISVSGSQAANVFEKKPNVLIILLDDAGYNDFGFMGSPDLETPRIDSLAREGIVCTDAHVSATVSGPSRAGILTGRYQQRFGYECNRGPNSNVYLPVDEETIGSVFQRNGYRTACIGKWHQGDSACFHPNRRGFDYFYGFLSGGRSYFYRPFSHDKPGNRSNLLENDCQQHFGEKYLTDLFGEKSVEFLERTSEPFLLYLAFNAVHTPMEATPEDMARYDGHPRQKLAAMTWAVDRAIGRVVDCLKVQGRLDNTLIFFLSDNGGAHNNMSSNFPYKGFKGNKYEAGHRVPFFVHWGDRLREGGRYDGLVSSLDIFATALAAAGIEETVLHNPCDGVDLMPFLTHVRGDEPHSTLYWRKDQAAAVRDGDYKLIRVEEVGIRLYDLKNDPGETHDLSVDTLKVKSLSCKLDAWEKSLGTPLWTEGKEWNEVTREIHRDLMENRPVRFYTPAQMKKRMCIINK